MINLKKAKAACNKVLAELKADRNHGNNWPVNWADLRCVDVLYALDCDGGKRLIFEIAEASPDNFEFGCEVARRLWKIYTNKTLQIDVRTEW